MKRIVSVLLAVFLVVSLLGACKAKEKIITVTSIVEKEVEVEVIKEVIKEVVIEVEKVLEHKEITWMMRDAGNPNQWDPELKVYGYMNEAANITIIPIMVTPDVYMEKLSIIVAGDILEDITNVGNRDIFIEAAVPDYDLIQTVGPLGLLVSLSDNLDKLPHYEDWMEKFPSYVGGITAADGDIYNPTSSIGGVIRSDKSGKTEFESMEDLLQTLTDMRAEMDAPIWTNRSGMYNHNLLALSFGTSLTDFPYYD